MNRVIMTTLTVPNMAPDAPVEGEPSKLGGRVMFTCTLADTRQAYAKFAPRTLPNMPAAKYRMKKPPDPISRSTYMIIQHVSTNVNNGYYLCGDQHLGKHIQSKVHETSVKKNGCNKPRAHKRYWRLVTDRLTGTTGWAPRDWEARQNHKCHL